MDKIILGKTFLEVKDCLEDLTIAIDKVIYELALDRKKFGMRNTFSLVNKIISYTQKKKSLIKLKHYIDDSLLKINDEDLQLLVLRFIDKMSIDTISKLYAVSTRTVFRKISKALTSFSIALKIENNKKFLHSIFLEDNWIYEVYEKNLAVKNARESKGGAISERDELTSNSSLIKIAMSEFRNMPKENYISF